jgi:hypothetical protein
MTIYNNGGVSLGTFGNPGINNIAASKFVPGYSAITSAAGTTVLTADSNYYQNLVGSTTQTFQLPDATTLLVGTTFIFDNNSSGNLTVVDNASGPIETIPGGAASFVYLYNNSTVAGSWNRHAFLPASYDFNVTTANFGTATITNATWNGNTIGTAYGGTGLTTFGSANYALYSTSSSALVAGTLPVAAGGSGAVTFTANGVLYGDGTNPLGATAAGTTGQVLIGNTGAAPSWGSVPSTGAVTSFQTSLSGLTPSTATTGAVTLAGTLGVTSGGTGTSTAFTAGSVVFAGSSGTYTQDNANFFWDDTNNRLGINAGGAPGTVISAVSTIEGQAIINVVGTTNGSAFRADNSSGSFFLGIDNSTGSNFSVGNYSRLIWSQGAYPIVIFTDSAERMRIHASGGVSIGTTTDPGAADLQVAGAIVSTRIDPRSLALASTSGAITPNSDLYDQVNYSLTGSSSFSNPSGTPVNGQKINIRIYAASTQSISSWSSSSGGYRAIGVTLPTSVATGKTVYVGAIWNSTDSFWDVVAAAVQA